MALKAGYMGIKKSMLGLINSISSAKIIKTIGDGLNLTNAGKLNVTAATASKIGGIKVGSGLSIDDGVLSAEEVTSWKYDVSGTSYKAGTYIDSNGVEHDVKEVIITKTSLAAGWNSIDTTGLNIDRILDATAILRTGTTNGDWFAPYYRQSTNYACITYSVGDGLRINVGTESFLAGSTAEIKIKYVEAEEE